MAYLGDSYTALVSDYLNKINPATGMYWTNAEVAAAMEVPLEEVQALVAHAQQVNYDIVVSTGQVATQEQILNAPPVEESIALPEENVPVPITTPTEHQQTGPAIKSTVQFWNREGQKWDAHNDSDYSYWQEADNSWSQGRSDGSITRNIIPPFFPSGVASAYPVIDASSGKVTWEEIKDNTALYAGLALGGMLLFKILR